MVKIALISLVASVGWNAPLTCPTEASFRQLVEARLGGERPEDYPVEIDARVNDFGNRGYELALRATYDGRGPPIEFTTEGMDCIELTSFAAAWVATQIDPLGLGPEAEDVALETIVEIPAAPVAVRPELPERDLVEVERHEPEPPLPEDPAQLSGLVGVAAGGVFAFSSPVTSAFTGRVGLKWRALQLTLAGHAFVDSALSDVKNSKIRPQSLVVWSTGPELCWAPSIQRLLLWGCVHFDGGQLHLVSRVFQRVHAPWLRVGVSAGVGFQANATLQPFVSLGFSHVVSDVLILVDGESMLRPIGAFASVSIGANFIIRRKRESP